MHITFLIGNGFDRNLGLDTTYSDFVKVYKNLTSKSEHINAFRNHIKENEELWSKAEEALGQYTQQLEKGQGQVFSECQIDFCSELAKYLKEQEKRIDYARSKDAIQKAFQKFRNLSEPFSATERTRISGLYQKHLSESIHFDFINYNYTHTLDRCLEIVGKTPGLLGAHTSNGVNYKHLVGKVCHVHGTVDGQMVFGVNDDSQITKTEVFEENDGDLSKELLIKKSANETYGENTDEKTTAILNNSNIIYVYGMALGITDKLWWERICIWLTKDETRRLILHQYEMPSAEVIPFRQKQFERRIKRKFCELGELPKEKLSSVGNRINVTPYNIFEPMKNIATPLVECETSVSEERNMVTLS